MLGDLLELQKTVVETAMTETIAEPAAAPATMVPLVGARPESGAQRAVQGVAGGGESIAAVAGGDARARAGSALAHEAEGDAERRCPSWATTAATSQALPHRRWSVAGWRDK